MGYLICGNHIKFVCFAVYDDFEIDDDYPGMVGRKPSGEKRPKEEEDEETYFSTPREIKYEPFYYACDNVSTLYVIDNDNEKISSYYHETATEMSKPYFIKRIPRSNLLIVVINSSYVAVDPNYKETTEPITVSYTTQFPCHKLSLNDLPRRRLEECYTEHPEVCHQYPRLPLYNILIFRRKNLLFAVAVV